MNVRKSSACRSTSWRGGVRWWSKWRTHDHTRGSADGGHRRASEPARLARVPARDAADEVRRAHARAVGPASGRAFDDVVAGTRAAHDRGRTQLVPAGVLG